MQEAGTPRVERIHLVRHGEVENPTNVVYGSLPGFGLSRVGEAQAELAARRLDTMVGENVALVHSPLERAKDTAAIIRATLAASRHVAEASVDERLGEARSGFDGLPRRFDVRQYAARWLDFEVQRNRESPRQVAERMRRAIDAARAMGCADVVLVSHQFPIQAVLVVMADPTSALRRHAPWLFIRNRCSHASITTVTFDGERVRDRSYWEPP